MLVHVENSQDRFEIEVAEVQNLVAATLSACGAFCDEVHVHFVTVEQICKLHEEYFNDPSPTDCISFPMDGVKESEDYTVLGDVFVCPDVAYEYSIENSVDFNEELSLYVVHGLLHLIGLDDIEEEDEKQMREQEALCLHHLKKQNLILNPFLKTTQV